MGFNTAPIAVPRMPMCAVCDSMEAANAPCRPRDVWRTKPGRDTNSLQSVKPGGDVSVYLEGDALSARCLGCVGQQWCGDQPTPNDARYRVFITDGDVYARIVNGRQGQHVIIEVEIGRSGSAHDIYKHIEVII